MIDLKRYSVTSESYAGWFFFRWRARRALERCVLLPGGSAHLVHWRRDGFLDFVDSRHCPTASEALEGEG